MNRGHCGARQENAPVWAMGGDQDLVFAGMSDGIYLSQDKGRSWARAESGPPPVCPGIAFIVSDSLILGTAILGN